MVINPSTPGSVLEEILPDVDLVVVMTVDPGFGHQHFLRSTLPKIRRVREMIDNLHRGCELEVDGGVDQETAPLAYAAGESGRLGSWFVDFRRHCRSDRFHEPIADYTCAWGGLIEICCRRNRCPLRPSSAPDVRIASTGREPIPAFEHTLARARAKSYHPHSILSLSLVLFD